jgi:hypothetical protein
MRSQVLRSRDPPTRSVVSIRLLGAASGRHVSCTHWGDEGPIDAGVRSLGRSVTSFAEVGAFALRYLSCPTQCERGARLR